MVRKNENPRELILMAIEAHGNDGATKEELIETLAGDLENVSMSVGKTLGNMLRDEILEMARGRYYVKGTAKPSNAQSNNNGRVEIAPFQAGRKGETVTVYSSPQIYQNIVRVEFHFENGHTVKMPFSTSLRICTGPEIPNWSPQQESNRGIKSIILVQKGGNSLNIPCNPQSHITIDFEG